MSKVFFSEELTREGLNPYEVVLLASKEARRLNKTRLNAGVPEGQEKVTSVALQRLAERKIQGQYRAKNAGDESDATG